MKPLDLNTDLSGVSTDMPRLADGDYPCGIKSTEIAENKAGTGHNMCVIFKTTEEGFDQNGEPLNAGMEVRKYYPLQQSENPNAPDFRRDICVLIDAALGTDQNTRPALTEELIASLVGEEVTVGVKLRESEEYGLQNEVKYVRAA